MSDLVERLRKIGAYLTDEAADEIERQEEQLYRLGEEMAKDKLEIERLRAEVKTWACQSQA